MDRSPRDLTLAGMTLRNLYRQPVRTLLTALGVAVGTSAIVAFGSITRGMWTSTTATLQYSGGDMMIFQRGVAADIFSSLDETATEKALRADPGVERVAPALWQIMPVWPAPICLVMGMKLEDIARHQERIVHGRAAEGPFEAVVGTVAAKMLGADLGKRIYISHKWFTVVGVYQTEVVYFNGAIVVPLESLQEICLRKGQVTNFQLKVRPGEDPYQVAERLESTLPNIAAIVSAEQYKKIDQGLEVANAVVGVIAFLSIVIGGVIVMNTMWMTVHERTREIGVLRALGWSRRRIVRMIILEAMGVGLLAWILGSSIGMALAEIAARLPMAEQLIDPVYDWRPFTIAFAVAVLLSMAGGAAPAWRAARISPVEALRYE